MADDIITTEYLDESGLKRYDTKRKAQDEATYVKKEHKTGSDDAYKVLSDNNFTDELLQKLMNAGDSSFSGNYDDLLNIPTLDGTQLKGTLTKDGLNIASKDDIPGIATTTKAGTTKPDGTTIEVDSDGTIKVKDNLYVKSTDLDSTLGDYVEESDLESTLADYAKTEEVAQDIEDAKTEMEEYVDGKLSSTYKPAGSVETIAQLPALTAENLGNVYNVKASFITTDNFVEGSGKDYPAGTNVVIVETETDVYKYDALSGFVDLSGYIPEGAIQPIPNSKIDALFE